MSKTIKLNFVLLLFILKISAQQQFQISIQPSTSITVMPGIHSFAFGNWNNEWIFIGGRTNGLHGFQPYNGFQPAGINDSVFIVNPATNQKWSASLSTITDTILHDCAAAAFNQYFQFDSMLYVTGGYGFDNIALDYFTHPYLLAINLNQLSQLIKAGASVEPAFRKYYNPNMAIAGGGMFKIDSTYYLVFGHKFDGRYAEVDTLGFFVQQYSNEIRKFTIDDDGTNLSISNYSVIHDSVNFHRRDYNLVPQIFPNHNFGLTAFGGVFQYGINLPFLNPIDIDASGATVSTTFNQNLNQYSTGEIPIYDSLNNAMHTIFLGGMGEYTFDTLSQQLMHDTLVPFVKTISKISRFANGSMMEFALPQKMPGYLGTNSIFIPSSNIGLYHNSIINLNQLITGNTLIGYLVGGIASSDSNISAISSLMSHASDTVYEVYLNKSLNSGLNEMAFPDDVTNFIAYPNPFEKLVNIDFDVKEPGRFALTVYDVTGKKLAIVYDGFLKAGKQNFKWLPEGNNPVSNYFIRITSGKLSRTIKVINR